MEIKTKVCPKCGVEKELTMEFWQRDRSRKNGFQNWCKRCLSVRARPYNNDYGNSVVGNENLTSVCPKCAVEKPITEEYWYKNPRSKYKLDLSRCKSCLKQANKSELRKLQKRAWNARQPKKISITKLEAIVFLTKKHRYSMFDITDTLIELAKQELIANILLKQIKKRRENHESNSTNV